MVAAVERAVQTRWERALERASATEGTTEERVNQVRTAFRRELVTVGAAAGGTAAVPGVGTMAAIGLTASEIGWTATRATDMILTVAAIHGHQDAPLNQRKAWTLALFAFEDNAADSYHQLARELDANGLGQRETPSMAALEQTAKLPSGALEKLNSRLGRYVISKYGAKRSALWLGKLLPFGIGAIIGGTANHVMVGTVIDRANAFFTEMSGWQQIPPPALPSAPSAVLPPPQPEHQPPPPPIAPPGVQ